jgi:hypothetical protein
MPVDLALWRRGQEDLKFETSLGYTHTEFLGDQPEIHTERVFKTVYRYSKE